jgi:nitrogen fixation-related uncharacterized protein
MTSLPYIAIVISIFSAAIAFIAFFRTLKRESIVDKDKREARALFLIMLAGVKNHSGGMPVFEPKNKREQQLYELLVDQNRLKRGHLGNGYTIIGEI